MAPAAQQFTTPADEPVNQAVIDNRAPSVAHLFRSRVEASEHEVAYQLVRDGLWGSLTWGQVREQAYRLAAGLIALGVAPEDCVAVASATRYEWAAADLAVMCAGAATTTIYPTTISSDVSYILSNSGSKVVFAEDEAQVDKLRETRDAIPGVLRVVTFDGVPDGDWVISLRELEQMGVELLTTNPGVVDERIDALVPERLATIIYTSGTTGRPKGVRLTHDAWTYEAAAVDAIHILNKDDLQYLWLPLAHVFGKILLTLPLQIGFPTAIDGRVDKIVDNLAVVKPTFMGAAPRIFEKAHARITMMMAQEGGLKEKLFQWATGVGARAAELRAQGSEPTGLLAAQYALADRLVLHKVRERFGGRVRFFISGSAALNTDVAAWFNARRAAHPRGLRPHRDQRRLLRQPAQRLCARQRGPAPARHRGQARRATARSCSAAPASWRATTTTRRPPRRPSTSRGGCTPATSASSTSAASCASPTARRTCSRPRAASTSRPRPSRRCSRACAPTPATCSSTAPTATSSPR